MTISFFVLCSPRCVVCLCFFFFSSRRRHTRCSRDWSSDVCSSDLQCTRAAFTGLHGLDRARYAFAVAPASGRGRARGRVARTLLDLGRFWSLALSGPRARGPSEVTKTSVVTPGGSAGGWTDHLQIGAASEAGLYRPAPQGTELRRHHEIVISGDSRSYLSGDARGDDPVPQGRGAHPKPPHESTDRKAAIPHRCGRLLRTDESTRRIGPATHSRWSKAWPTCE